MSQGLVRHRNARRLKAIPFVQPRVVVLANLAPVSLHERQVECYAADWRGAICQSLSTDQVRQTTSGFRVSDFRLPEYRSAIPHVETPLAQTCSSWRGWDGLRCRHFPVVVRGMEARIEADSLGGTGSSGLGMREVFVRFQVELRRLARRERARHRPGDTLNTTALVNEAYLKLANAEWDGAGSPGHALAVACNTMRQVLVDDARARLAQKRGGGEPLRPLEDEALALSEDLELARSAIEIDNALRVLESSAPRQAQVVALRFFGGLNDREIGSCVGVEESTVRRDWLKARAWLFEQLHPDSLP